MWLEVKKGKYISQKPYCYPSSYSEIHVNYNVLALKHNK